MPVGNNLETSRLQIANHLHPGSNGHRTRTRDSDKAIRRKLDELRISRISNNYRLYPCVLDDPADFVLSIAAFVPQYHKTVGFRNPAKLAE
jgi:hypothetical protein